MKSEAKVRNGENGDSELNEVRRRAGMPERKATLENILAERQLELAWEGWRDRTWFALVGLRGLIAVARSYHKKKMVIPLFSRFPTMYLH